jgi:cobalamin synthase
MRRLGPLYPALVALGRTTIVRPPPELRPVGDDLPRSAPWVIALAVVIGFVGWVAAWLPARGGAAPVLAAAVAVAVVALLGGAVIETGFLHWAERRTGRAAPVTSGAMALIRFGALASVRPGRWLAALVAAELVGRWSALLLQRLGDPILDDADRPGLSMGEVSWAVVGVVSAAVAAAAGWMFGWAGIVALVVAGACAFGLGLEAQRRDGQPDGETLAAAALVGGTIALVAAALAAPGWIVWTP